MLYIDCSIRVFYAMQQDEDNCILLSDNGVQVLQSCDCLKLSNVFKTDYLTVQYLSLWLSPLIINSHYGWLIALMISIQSQCMNLMD